MELQIRARQIIEIRHLSKREEKNQLKYFYKILLPRKMLKIACYRAESRQFNTVTHPNVHIII